MNLCDASVHNRYCYDEEIDGCDGFYDCPYQEDENESHCKDEEENEDLGYQFTSYFGYFCFLMIIPLFICYMRPRQTHERLRELMECICASPRKLCNWFGELGGSFCVSLGCKEDGNSPTDSETTGTRATSTSISSIRQISSVVSPSGGGSNTEELAEPWHTNTSSTIQPTAPTDQDLPYGPLSSPPSYGEYENYAPVVRGRQSTRDAQPDNTTLPPTYSEALRIVYGSTNSTPTHPVPPPSYDSVV